MTDDTLSEGRFDAALRNLGVEYRPVASLTAYARNPRTHSPKQIRQIAESIRTFGFTNPVLIDDAGGVIAGHGRLAAAKLLGITRVPTIRLAEMTEAQKRAYILADNKLAENAGWNRETLALELQGLLELEVEFDLTVTGFETGEIDVLLDELQPADPQKEDDAPEVQPGPAVTQPGDMWHLGPHRLLCGDATNAQHLATLMGGVTAHVVFIDPPYNVPIDGHVCGLGRTKHGDFAMAAGEMSEEEFTAFLQTALGHLAAHSTDGAIHFVCMDWRHIHELMAAGRAVYSELKNLCVWAKGNGGMGSLYRSQHELVFVFKSGSGAHVNNVQLGQHGRYRTNVWAYPGVNSLRAGRQEDLAMHPTVKPVALVADAIQDCSHRNEIVLDSFGGSGTTLIAAEQTGRRGYVLELDPRYVDVAVRRYEELTGTQAIHAGTGLPFSEVAARQEPASAPGQQASPPAHNRR